jgi:hypothetical protein
VELVNKTPLAAGLTVTELQGEPHRRGILTAKATFRVAADGRLEWETDNPFPLFDHDQETDLGLLPRDDLPKYDPTFEVMLLGAAYAPGGSPVERTRVALRVGEERRELSVSGDREWVEDGDGWRISEPEPFVRMPLTYDRAYGGTCEVFVDRESAVTVSEPFNPAGRGFDPEPAARTLAEQLAAPEGYPEFDRTRRLPNVEDPDALIGRWEDAPRPVCWTAVPLHYAAHGLRSLAVPEDGKVPEVVELEEGLFHRAHSDWVIPHPPPGAPVVLEGGRPEGEWDLELPLVRVLADYRVEDRTGTRELVPQMLVLLPEEGRLYLVYRLLFTLGFEPETERSWRLRLERGWYAPGAPEER